MIAFVLLSRLPAAETIWRLDSLEQIGAQPVTMEGSPQIGGAGGARWLEFDGAKDGIFVAAIPFAGAARYTIEICFLPAAGGPAEQRFLHAQDAGGARALIETRLDGQGGWWLDTFIAPPSGRGLALIDPGKVHPTGQWYWAALRYDGKTMTHFVDGRKECEGPAEFAPFGAGRISLGVRQNRVHWFKGAIREVRFHTEAIAEERLQRIR